MSSLAIPLAELPTQQSWFWIVTVIVVAVLVFLNLLVLVAVHGREVRESVRARRAARFRPAFERTLAELRSARPDEDRLHATLSEFDELERPIAARMLIAEARGESEEQRARIRGVLRDIGAIDLALVATRRRLPWRRALAIQTLGVMGAEEAVPELIARLSDRSRHVREAAVRALGRIGDKRAVSPLAALFAHPGQVAPGLVYEALVAIGEPSTPVFDEGLASPAVSIRIASVYGVASLLEPGAARARLERMLADEAGPVRAAAAQMLGRVGGPGVTEELAGALRDDQPSVRRAAASALATHDDTQSVRLALDALEDPDRETALRAGEALVRLARQPAARDEAEAAIAASDRWPVETAKLLSTLEAL